MDSRKYKNGQFRKSPFNCKLDELLEKFWDRPIDDFSIKPANIWEFEEFSNIFSMVKSLIWSKILVHIRSYPFVSFHLPWNDDAMVEVFLESLELWFGTAVIQMPGSKKKDNCCFMLRNRGFYSIKQCVTHKRLVKIPLSTLKKSTSNFCYLDRPF